MANKQARPDKPCLGCGKNIRCPKKEQKFCNMFCKTMHAVEIRIYSIEQVKNIHKELKENFHDA